MNGYNVILSGIDFKGVDFVELSDFEGEEPTIHITGVGNRVFRRLNIGTKARPFTVYTPDMGAYRGVAIISGAERPGKDSPGTLTLTAQHYVMGPPPKKKGKDHAAPSAPDREGSLDRGSTPAAAPV